MISRARCEKYLKEAFGPDSVSLPPEQPPYGWLPLIWQMGMEVTTLCFFEREFALAVLLVKPTLKQLIELDDSFRAHLSIPHIFAFESDEPTMPSLLASRDIPHLIPEKRLFVPKLGVIYQEVPLRAERRHERVTARLSSAGRIIVSLIILDATRPEKRANWEKPIKCHDLQRMFTKNREEGFSPATFTRIFQQLSDLGFGESLGRGPQKRFQFRPREELWPQLFSCEVETILQATTIFRPIEKVDLPFFYAGASALAHGGNLDCPLVPEIAMERAAFFDWKQSEDSLGPEKILVQLWRHLPLGMPANKCINPVDLALTMHKTIDPRKREVLAEILRSYDLDDSPIWRSND